MVDGWGYGEGGQAGHQGQKSRQLRSCPGQVGRWLKEGLCMSHCSELPEGALLSHQIYLQISI